MKSIKSFLIISMILTIVLGVVPLRVSADEDITWDEDHLKEMMAYCFSDIDMPNASTQYRTPFYDVNGTKYANPVYYLYKNRIVSGKSAYYFGVNDSLERCEFVQILWRMAGSPTVISYIPFSDVRTDAWYYRAVVWAYCCGVTRGTSDTEFSPHKKLTYQEVFGFLNTFSTSIVHRTSAVNAKYNMTSPSNLSEYSSWARRYAIWAYQNGIVYGVSNNSNNTFGPKAECTRGDAAYFIFNYFKSFQKKYALLLTGPFSINTSRDPIWYWRFQDWGVSTNDITVVHPESYTQTTNAIINSFSNATCIDYCYLYINGRSATTGSSVYNPVGYFFYRYFSDDTLLTGMRLYYLLDRYNTHFAIICEGSDSWAPNSRFKEYFVDRNSRKFGILTSYYGDGEEYENFNDVLGDIVTFDEFSGNISRCWYGEWAVLSARILK